MKGLDLSEKYYRRYGEPMLQDEFGEILPFIAVGLTGSGSECYGYDDEISRDHDFEPGFCIFLPDGDVVDEKTAFRLERAYAKLPKEFMGYSRGLLGPVGGNRHGVFRASDFYMMKTGSPDGYLTAGEWVTLPESVLAEATNGKIFRDDSGLVTQIRERLSRMPLDILKKRLAGCLVTMAQAGRYNYPRCIERGDSAAAQLSCYEFTKAAVRAIFLLNRRYMPYYKWAFRALRELPVMGESARILEQIISAGNGERDAEWKKEAIETVSLAIAGITVRQGLSKKSETDLEKLAYSVNDSIDDIEIRSMDIFSGV